VDTDGLIDLLVKFSAALDVVRRKPATHSLTLQISMEAFCKLLVLARIANKTVVLNR
jgi:hypothetical protein